AVVAHVVEVEVRVAVGVRCPGHRIPLELDVQRIRIGEVLELHGAKPRSKKALCTVSPSASRITRSQRPPASGMCLQSRTLPSACSIRYSGARTTRSIQRSSIAERSGRRLIARK